MQVQDERSHESKDETIALLQRRIEELTSANLLLKEQLARKEQFTAMIAHDLRSPLTPIISYAEAIVRQLGGEPYPSLRKYVSIIRSQARRMLRLASDLQDSTQLDTGQFSLSLQCFDLVALVTEMVEQLKPLAPFHKLVAEVPTEPVIGNWDKERLQQVVGNLLDNAIKYSDTETVITVRVWTTADKVFVSVHNFGAAILSNEASLLFQPFVRLSSAGSRQGSGLGLYISKSITEAHKGALWLEPHKADTPDTAKGPKGTTFCFYLPLHTSEANKTL